MEGNPNPSESVGTRHTSQQYQTRDSTWLMFQASERRVSCVLSYPTRPARPACKPKFFLVLQKNISHKSLQTGNELFLYRGVLESMRSGHAIAMARSSDS